MSRREQVFWGWGEPGAGPQLPEHAAPFLQQALGVSGEVVDRPVALAEVRLGAPALPAALRAALVEIVGEGAVRDDREMRVLRCRGKSYLDLLAQRAGDCEGAPDVVVAPGTHEEVRAVLETCAREGVAVVPFGGGTSVVGGLGPPARDRFGAVVSLDLARMEALESIDPRSLTATFGPGVRLPEADRMLAAQGFTLGHFPQSYEWATVGGCVATRSAGQASTGFGRIDENVVSLRCATPAGDLETLGAPGTAAGPGLLDALVGSEGAFGVLTSVTMRVRRLPQDRRFEGWFARSFEDGWEALRSLEQAGAAPDVARLSDEAETEMSMALAGRSGAKAWLGGRVLSARGYAEGCLVILGWEGAGIARRRREAARLMRRAGAMAVGTSPGKAWSHARYAGPHLRDDLMDRGVLVETLETATTWSNLANLYGSVADALRATLDERGTPPRVMCHVSHLYPTGASLYFTVLAAQDRDDPAGQWEAAKAAACLGIVSAGGTITHHHAVGRDHAPYLGAETGDLGLELLQALKERCDPAGVMNPGVLLAG